MQLERVCVNVLMPPILPPHHVALLTQLSHHITTWSIWKCVGSHHLCSPEPKTPPAMSKCCSSDLPPCPSNHSCKKKNVYFCLLFYQFCTISNVFVLFVFVFVASSVNVMWKSNLDWRQGDQCIALFNVCLLFLFLFLKYPIACLLELLVFS